MDSAFYNAAVTGAIRRGGARFSVTVPMNSSIRAAPEQLPGIAHPGHIEETVRDLQLTEPALLLRAAACRPRPPAHPLL
jgi:hypothetical protein